MRFLPTINLWAKGMAEAVLSGQLKLQRGQYVLCGDGIKSRFIGSNGRSIDVCHGHNNKEVLRKFKMRCELIKKRSDN